METQVRLRGRRRLVLRLDLEEAAQGQECATCAELLRNAADALAGRRFGNVTLPLELDGVRGVLRIAKAGPAGGAQ